MAEQTTLNENWIPSVRALLSKYYPDYSPNQFDDLLAQNIHTSSQVLEIGAGSGRNHQNHFELRGKVARYVGVDPDPSVLNNPFLDEGHQASAESLPFGDETFDLVFHNYVAEHFESPLACNREIARVLKPGGLLLFQTPSRYYYPCVVASMTPHWFHEFYIRRFGSGRTNSEVFSTFYRLNDANSIKAQLAECGFAAPPRTSTTTAFPLATCDSTNSHSSLEFYTNAPSKDFFQVSAAKSSSSPESAFPRSSLPTLVPLIQVPREPLF